MAGRVERVASSNSRSSEDLLTRPSPASGADAIATAAWSRRVRRVGGRIQLAFAAFWLVRGSVVIGGEVSVALVAVSAVAVACVLFYATRVATRAAPRPTSAQGKRIERAVTLATVIEFAAAFALPVIVTSAGHSDWVLPSIAITIGPLLLYLDHLVHIPRYRLAGWALSIGPLILVATMSGTALVASTGIAAGLVLLTTALAGFHDLTGVRPRVEQNEAGDAPLSASAAAR